MGAETQATGHVDNAAKWFPMIDTPRTRGLSKSCRISKNLPALMLIILVAAACTPRLASPTPPINLPATEVLLLPDLTIKLIYIEMQGRQGNLRGGIHPL